MKPNIRKIVWEEESKANNNNDSNQQELGLQLRVSQSDRSGEPFLRGQYTSSHILNLQAVVNNRLVLSTGVTNVRTTRHYGPIITHLE